MKPSLGAAALAGILFIAAQTASAQTSEFKFATVEGHNVFYREAGPRNAQTIVLLHGFPSSSHMFRDLIPKLSGKYHVIAPDYIGFGYSDTPLRKDFNYTFDNLSRITDGLLSQVTNGHYALYLQDYGGPVGFRIAAAHPERVDGLIIQNSNAYVEGISELAFGVLAKFGSNRTPETEKPVANLLTADGIKFGYVTGSPDASRISPDSYTFDTVLFQSRAENREIQLDLFADYQNNVSLYDAWHAYFRKYQPKTLIVWGKGDPFFTVKGAQAFQKDLKNVDLNIFDAGHFALEEKLDVIAPKIDSFLSGLR